MTVPASLNRRSRLSRIPNVSLVRSSPNAGVGRAANGSPAKGAAGFRLRSAQLVAVFELVVPGRAALNFAARPPLAPDSRRRECGGGPSRSVQGRYLPTPVPDFPGF